MPISTQDPLPLTKASTSQKAARAPTKVTTSVEVIIPAEVTTLNRAQRSERLLADRIWRPLDSGGVVERLVLLSGLGSLLIALCGHFSFSVLGVQSTLQTFAVMFVGLSCGVRIGLISVGLWLLQGALGWPVFANGVGMSYIVGPTAGYFAGFFPAVALVGWYAKGGISRGHVIVSGIKLAVVVILAHTFIYICGLSWLHQFIVTELDAKGLLATESSILRTVQVGMLPFLLGDAIKIGLLVALMPCLHSWLSFECVQKRFEM